MSALRRSARARRRGVSHVGTVLECAMVMGWFVALMLGEKKVSDASDARRSAEEAARANASASTASYCAGGGLDATPGGLPPAHVEPSVVPHGAPPVSAAVSLLTSLGLGAQPTFPYYTLPEREVRVRAASTSSEQGVRGRVFGAERSLGCLEAPLDTPSGSLKSFRQKLWKDHLKGY